MAMVGFTFVNPEVNPTEAALGTGFGHVGHVGDSFAMVSPWIFSVAPGLRGIICRLATKCFLRAPRRWTSPRASASVETCLDARCWGSLGPGVCPSFYMDNLWLVVSIYGLYMVYIWIIYG